MTYDRTDWHSGGDYPKDLPPENGGTHIGMFMAWIIKSGLEGEFHFDNTEELEKVKNEEMTGREYFSLYCDEKLVEDDLGEDANSFANSYYQGGAYFNDYETVLSKNLPTLYHVQDTWENYHKLAPKLTEQFKSWQQMKSKGGVPLNQGKADGNNSPKKPWWKFW
ncbi:hypothetical protein [Thaumasiovibrio subtropicus]|uniref:DUF7832 domain-containing protein n=1 Tax=Thaumasiovibrio subtropicus TaxID=1891207 RepID=UPI00186551CA|nr:hypothetical protein [Thaumasiovibrio subtropicus]